MNYIGLPLAVALFVGGSILAQANEETLDAWPVAQPECSTVLSLNGEGWLLATDPEDVGRTEKWFEAPRPEAQGANVPGTIQDASPSYHGVAWYWLDFEAPTNPSPAGRTLLRFSAVDYLAERRFHRRP